MQRQRVGPSLPNSLFQLLAQGLHLSGPCRRRPLRRSQLLLSSFQLRPQGLKLSRQLGGSVLSVLSCMGGAAAGCCRRRSCCQLQLSCCQLLVSVLDCRLQLLRILLQHSTAGHSMGIQLTQHGTKLMQHSMGTVER